MVKSFVIPLVVFFSGAAVMMMEIAGARVIAPYVGNSLPAWTALISVVLGSLSVGYMVGGRLADRYPSHTMLSVILFLSACLVSLIKPLELLFLPLTTIIRDIRYLALVFSLGLFALPSVFLGMISPYAIRLSLHALSRTGKTAGNLYALSTIGSIVGTIVTGFYLLGIIGHANVLALIVSILMFCGILVWIFTRAARVFLLSVAIAPLVFLFQFHTQHPLGKEYDTPYQRLFIREGTDPITNRPIRMILTDLYSIQSSMFLDRDDDLVLEYLKVFRIADVIVPTPQRVLVIGGAGYAYPKDLLRRYWQAMIDVVEIDPGMTMVAKKWFSLTEDERLGVYHEDGRMFLARSTNTYDVIYMDAFGELVTPPFHLLTQEMFQLIDRRLRPNGVMVMNVIAAYEGSKNRFFSSIYKTVASVFPFVTIYPVQQREDRETQNIILLASRNVLPLDGAKSFSPSDDAIVFTDSFAPVEQYAMDLLR